MIRMANSPKIYLFLFLLAFAFCTTRSSARNLNPATRRSYKEFVKSSCSKTSYPRMCLSSLAAHSTLIQTSPKILAHAALNVTLKAAKSTAAILVNLSHSHGMNPREVGAMRDCIEQLGDTVDQLRISIGEFGETHSSKSVELLFSDIMTWVSAAMTDESTCSDGFAGDNNVNEQLKQIVRYLILNMTHLTSNALSLVNSYYLSIHA